MGDTTSQQMDSPTQESESTCPIRKPNGSKKIEELKFDNSTLRDLPVDDSMILGSREVQNACFSLVAPTKVTNPKLVAYSPTALALIDLSPDETKREDFSRYFSGNKIIPGSEPAAHCYCGYQFGYFSGQLGDGATMYLGEVINSKNERWEIQFKGAGPTPFSRTADGRKVLRSSIREFLCSEAMYFLGIPTTRAATCVTSDSKVTRDIYYTGNNIKERCSIIMRIAETFIRFGSFEITKEKDEYTGRSGPSKGNKEILITLMNYVLKNNYSEIFNDKNLDFKEKVKSFFKEITLRTARLVSDWQCVGFCHGVLNTDNMSITGLTIDYGPFGFLDAFDENHICNGSDDGGRYSYKNQPSICKWNLLKLAEALGEMAGEKELKEIVEQYYDSEFKNCYNNKMQKKLGLKLFLEGDEQLVVDLLEVMQETGADWTNSWRILSEITIGNEGNHGGKEVLEYLLTQVGNLEEMAKRVKTDIPVDKLITLMQVAQQEPRMLPMFGIRDPNVLVMEWEKYQKSKEWKDKDPKEKEKSDEKLWSDWIEKYILRLHKEIEGKEKDEVEKINKERQDMMKSTNPRFILRNYIVQQVIELAEKGDFTEVQNLLGVLEDPYDLGRKEWQKKYEVKPPTWATDLCVTCSS